MNELSNNKKLRDEIGKNALKTANEYSSISYAKKVLDVYNLVINKDPNIVKRIIHGAKRVLKKSGDNNE